MVALQCFTNLVILLIVLCIICLGFYIQQGELLELQDSVKYGRHSMMLNTEKAASKAQLAQLTPEDYEDSFMDQLDQQHPEQMADRSNSSTGSP